MSKLSKRLRTLSLSSQIFLIFSSFIILLTILQYTVYSIMFSDYVLNRQKKEVQDILYQQVDELRKVKDDNYYDVLNKYAELSNGICVILDEDYNFILGETSSLSMKVVDTKTYESYTILLPAQLDLRVADRVKVGVIPSSQTGLYDMYSLSINNQNIYTNDRDDLIQINGVVTELIKPKNLNDIYKNNQLVTTELFHIRNNNAIKELGENEAYTYNTKTDLSENLVYLHRLNEDRLMLSIYVLSTNSNLFDILSTYNMIIYAAIIILAIFISLIVAKSISRPIKNIDEAAKQIAQFNFDVKTEETMSKETTSLSDNINKIAKNLSTNIEELTKKNEEMAALLDHQLVQADIRKRFIQAISHELKTPLMVINLSVQGILDGIFEGEESTDELHHVLAEITNIDGLVKDLLDVYRMEDTNLHDKDEKINLKQMTEDSVRTVDNLLKQYDQTITINSSRSPIIYGDKKQINMVVNNIITNAIKYTPNGERIVISITEKKDKIIFSCVNYGVTIPEEKLPHLTEAFYRADESRTKNTKTKGTGLGLYIVRETLKAHDFEFSISNVQNGVNVQFIAKKYD